MGDVFDNGQRLGTGVSRLLLAAIMFLGERVEEGLWSF
jgi:hypothetical protein